MGMSEGLRASARFSFFIIESVAINDRVLPAHGGRNMDRRRQCGSIEEGPHDEGVGMVRRS